MRLGALLISKLQTKIPPKKDENTVSDTFSTGSVNQNYELPDYRYNAVLTSTLAPMSAPKPISEVIQPNSIAGIQSIIDNCNYSKKNVIENPDNLSIYLKGDDVYLKGFYRECCEDGTYEGICEELTQMAGAKIAQAYKDKYSVLAIFTKGTKYNFNNHMCIGLIKRTPENDKIISHIEEIDKISKRKDKLEEELKTGDKPAEKVAELKSLEETYKRELAANTKRIKNSKFWTNALFVDPSFKIISNINHIPSIYQLSGFNSLEGNNPFNRTKKMSEGFTPLGFVQDIFPELAMYDDFRNDSLVTFGISNRDKKKIDIVIYNAYNDIGKLFTSDDLLNNYPGHSFCKFIQKLETELEKAYS